jgi:L-histidine Nalpha-methyltransferase
MIEPAAPEEAPAGGAAAADARRAMLAEVRQGLSRRPREISPKFFYDRRGSELFERITELPEYYLTRAERALLQRWMPEWLERLRPRSLLELGAGSAEKTRIVLDALVPPAPAAVYVPVDVSAEFLHATAERLRADYPALEVRPAVADISGDFTLPTALPGPVLYAFLGSTLGNFAPPAAVRLLRTLRGAMQPDDRLLLGVDLRKDASVLESAYNDSAGVTAEFNRNMLRALNHALDADFDVDAYEHLAFYNREQHRIEMHLVAQGEQRVAIPGAGAWTLNDGETIRTEISCKHDRDSMEALFAGAELRIERWQPDDEARYAILLGTPDA